MVKHTQRFQFEYFELKRYVIRYMQKIPEKNQHQDIKFVIFKIYIKGSKVCTD